MAEDDEHLAAALDEQRRAVSFDPRRRRGGPRAARACASASRPTAPGWRARAPGAAGSPSGWPAPLPRSPLLAVVLAVTERRHRPCRTPPPSRPSRRPGPRPRTAHVARRPEDGVGFPDWARKFGWNATGKRTGEIEGRPATTIYYEKDGKTLAYTIVSGDALDVPDDARP